MKDLIIEMKTNWLTPRKLIFEGVESYFKTGCYFENEYEKSIEDIPEELIEFYHISNGAYLFKDIEFGQWGLRIIPYEDLDYFNTNSKEWRGSDISHSDLVFGEFLGDLDLLIISTDKHTYGNIIICPPVYPKKDWFYLNIGFKEFLTKYNEANGLKFWENGSF